MGPIEIIILLGILLFIIIHFAVRAAIISARNISVVNEQKDNPDLVSLRDIGVLSNEELEQVIDIYNEKLIKSKNQEKYVKYHKTLTELKEMGFFSDEIYDEKIVEIKESCKID